MPFGREAPGGKLKRKREIEDPKDPLIVDGIAFLPTDGGGEWTAHYASAFGDPPHARIFPPLIEGGEWIVLTVDPMDPRNKRAMESSLFSGENGKAAAEQWAVHWVKLMQNLGNH